MSSEVIARSVIVMADATSPERDCGVGRPWVSMVPNGVSENIRQFLFLLRHAETLISSVQHMLLVES